MPCKLLQVLQKVLRTSACVQAWCDKKGLDTAIHPIPKCVIFLEDLLQEMVEKKSKDPFGTIRVARKALSKIRYFLAAAMAWKQPLQPLKLCTGSFKEECLPPMENSSARRLSSNLPAAKLLQPPQKLE